MAGAAREPNGGEKPEQGETNVIAPQLKRADVGEMSTRNQGNGTIKESEDGKGKSGGAQGR